MNCSYNYIVIQIQCNLNYIVIQIQCNCITLQYKCKCIITYISELGKRRLLGSTTCQTNRNWTYTVWLQSPYSLNFCLEFAVQEMAWTHTAVLFGLHDVFRKQSVLWMPLEGVIITTQSIPASSFPLYHVIFSPHQVHLSWNLLYYTSSFNL